MGKFLLLSKMAFETLNYIHTLEKIYICRGVPWWPSG